MFDRTRRVNAARQWAVSGLTVAVICAIGLWLTGFGHAQDAQSPDLIGAPGQITVEPRAETVDIRPAVRELVVRPRLDRFSDMAAAEGEEEAAQTDYPSADAPVDLGAGRWLVVALANPSSVPQNRLLILQSPTLAGSGLLGTGRQGLRVSTAVRWTDGSPAQPLVWANGRPGVRSYEVTLPPGRTTKIALLAEEAGAPYALSLWDPRAFQRLERLTASGKGVLLGVLIVLTALIAGRWVLDGHREDLYGTLFVIAAMLFLATAVGSHFVIADPTSAFAGGLHGAALALFAASGLFFLHHKLPLERIHPALPLAATGIAALGVLLAIAAAPGFGVQSLAGPYAMICALMAAAATVLLSQKGEFKAPALLPGTIFLALCGIAAAVLTFVTPGPYAGLQALLLTSAVAAGTGLCAVASALTRPDMAAVLNDPEALPETDRVDVRGYERFKRDDPEPAEPSPMAVALKTAAEDEEQRFALAVEAAREGVFDLDILTEHLYVSPVVEATLGLPVGALVGAHAQWIARLHREDVKLYQSTIDANVARNSAFFDLEFRAFHEDGSERWFALRASAMPSELGRAQRIIGVISDISARKAVENRLAHDAVHDGLTGLATRTLLLDRMSRVMDGKRNPDDPGPALIVIDLDRFKLINEGLGQSEGDAMLIAVSRRLESMIGMDDTVARIGGDEFAMFLRHGIGEEGGENAGRIVADVIGESLLLDQQEVFPSASIGVVQDTDGAYSAADLLRDGEIALYRAKAQGQAQVVVFEPGEPQSKSDRLAYETDLKRAIERGEFTLLYQPVMSLKDGRLSGFEALLRWSHPEKGTLTPDHFLSLAEETGLIMDIGRMVLERAVDRLQAWQARWTMDTPLFVSVNVSSRQLLQPDFAEHVRSVLKPAGLPEKSLHLELTETMIMSNPEAAAQTLRMLLEDHVGLWLDDFGTGFSSLSHLQKFPFDALKIDRSFIAGMRAGDEGAKIIKAIIGLAHDLNMEVVAEGPETEDDVRRLRALGCEYAQGFVFGGALREDAAETLIAHAVGPAPASQQNGGDHKANGPAPNGSVSSVPPQPPRAASSGGTTAPTQSMG